MKILVLHSRLSGYWMACMKKFVENYGGTFTVVRQRVSPNAPFDFEPTEAIALHSFENFTDEELFEFSKKTDPDLIYVAGWAERAYLSIAKAFYDKGIPVLCGLDNQWENTIKQKVGYYFLRKVLPKRFTHLFVPGLYQFEAARKLGFPKEKIVTGLYSADVSLFSGAIKSDTKENFPTSFLFLGRLVEHKGLLELASAFGKLKKQTGTDWSLTVVGNGPLKETLKKHSGLNLRDFVQPEDLPGLMQHHGVFVLPSTIEPWGVVIHEAAAAGMPIISTYQCGAATAFVRNGYNGYLTEAGNVESLLYGLKQFIQKDTAELFEMGKRSVELSRQHTPASWASTLYQLIQNN